MTPNDDLVRWGEPPASDDELRDAEADGPADVDVWLQTMISTVLSYSGVGDAPPALALAVLRLGPDGFAATAGEATAVRDLTRPPADCGRVALRTGDKARIEATCEREGCLTVFAVGPTGAATLLYPDGPSSAAAQPAGVALRAATVLLTPPGGREVLYALWTREPLPAGALRGADASRLQGEVEGLPPGDWAAVALALDHA